MQEVWTDIEFSDGIERVTMYESWGAVVKPFCVRTISYFGGDNKRNYCTWGKIHYYKTPEGAASKYKAMVRQLTGRALEHYARVGPKFVAPVYNNLT